MSNYDNSMPNAYDSGLGATPPLIDKAWAISLHGIVKASEILLSIITFICAASYCPFINHGGGWVEFVSFSSFFTTVVIYVLYIFFVVEKIDKRMPADYAWAFFEFIFNATFTLFYFIAGVVAAVEAGHSAIIAAAVFAFLAFVAYAIDCVMMLQAWRGMRGPPDLGAGVESGTTAPPATTPGDPTTATTQPAYGVGPQY